MNKTRSCKNFNVEALGFFFCHKKGKINPAMCELCPDFKANSKYKNVKTEVEGITFDSKKEAARWGELSLLSKAGKIENLVRQKNFLLVPKGKDERPVYYVADFVYEEDGKMVCEDVKSPITRKNPAYIIKRKLFKYLYSGYEFRET